MIRGSSADAAKAAVLAGKLAGLTLGWGSMTARKIACKYTEALSMYLLACCMKHQTVNENILVRGG